MRVLHNAYQYDVYDLPAYQALAEDRGDGKAHFFVYTGDDYFVAVPLLLRPLETQGWMDATSVYGYAGPIASHDALPERVIQQFGIELHSALSDMQVVTVFSRLHPLMHQRPLLGGLGECRRLGYTIAVDLTLPPDEQWRGYRENHRRDIKKLEKQGVTCSLDREYSSLAEFVDVYHATMRRVHASPEYFFDQSYFEQLVSKLRPHVHLMIARQGSTVIAGGIFTSCGEIAEYHLGGTSDAFLQTSPMKLVIDAARLWANSRHMRLLHLGGGLGARDDSLFRFKSGFSDCKKEFFTWQWVLFPERYARLNASMYLSREQNGHVSESPSFFPEYRAPERGSLPLTD